MFRKTFLIASFITLACAPAPGQEAPAPSNQETTEAVAAASHFEVIGLADGDLLNIRASASATGMVVGRLPNGARLRNLGCQKVKNYDWCKVQDFDNNAVSGWTPARYLQPAVFDEASAGSGEQVAARAEVPCAREFGQPMTMCYATVKREGEGSASVTINWPDGGTRVIDFRNGKPDSSDAPDSLQVTRESGLNMIRIGKGERFEILDEMALGK